MYAEDATRLRHKIKLSGTLAAFSYLNTFFSIIR